MSVQRAAARQSLHFADNHSRPLAYVIYIEAAVSPSRAPVRPCCRMRVACIHRAGAVPAPPAPRKISERFALNGNYFGKVPLYLALNVILPRGENGYGKSFLLKKKKCFSKGIAAPEMEHVVF